MNVVCLLYMAVMMALSIVSFQVEPSLGQKRPQTRPVVGPDPGLPNAHPDSARLARNPRGEYALAWFPKARQLNGRSISAGETNSDSRSGGYKQYQGVYPGLGGRNGLSSSKPPAGSYGDFGERRR